MRTVLSINQDWLYKPSFLPEIDLKKDFAPESFEWVGIPHTNIELPYNYFDDKAFCFTSCYKKNLHIKSKWKGQRIFLDFEGVMNYARVYLNETFVGEHKGGYTPFSIEITDYVEFDSNNQVTVVVDSSERSDTPPFGGVIDYLTYGGIYRDVQLRIVYPAFIDSVFITTPSALDDKKQLVAEMKIDGVSDDTASEYSMEVLLHDNSSKIANSTKITLQSDTVHVQLQNLSNIDLWSLDSPQLYQVMCILYRGDQQVDSYSVRIGFRDIQFTTGGFFLNGEKIKLMGLNRHQAYPYVGYAMPARVQRKDADIMKYELGLNTVRTSHYPQSRHFLDRCDEIGLLVFEEIPGWQHIGDEQWQQQVLKDVEAMIVNHRNHPSVYIWGVRINESADNHDLYTRTNELARKLDPTRPTGGVRCLCESEFLEDVYTMNDFIHDNGYSDYLASVVRNYSTYDNTHGVKRKDIALREPRNVTGLDKDVPYMVTEYNGHMYPTKRFDQEERLVEHALRHSRVQNASHANDAIAGAIGWCAFDYNTHADFGSGDKICYHGVMDMFRIPKFAAYAYATQQSPERQVYLELASYWTRGERSIGGVIPLVVFTNCDEIEFIYGNKKIGKFTPNREQYPALSHPPIVIDEQTGEWGMLWEDGVFVGHVAGKEVIRRKYSRNPVPTHMILSPDDLQLNSGDWDATRVVIKVTDECDNILPYFHEVVNIEVTGEGELIGPSQMALISGQIAFWVKTTGEAGTIQVSVSCPVLNTTKSIAIEVEK